jgi:hypothetical protein
MVQPEPVRTRPVRRATGGSSGKRRLMTVAGKVTAAFGEGRDARFRKASRCYGWTARTFYLVRPRGVLSSSPQPPLSGDPVRQVTESS